MYAGDTRANHHVRIVTENFHYQTCHICTSGWPFGGPHLRDVFRTNKPQSPDAPRTRRRVAALWFTCSEHVGVTADRARSMSVFLGVLSLISSESATQCDNCFISTIRLYLRSRPFSLSLSAEEFPRGLNY